MRKKEESLVWLAVKTHNERVHDILKKHARFEIRGDRLPGRAKAALPPGLKELAMTVVRLERTRRRRAKRQDARKEMAATEGSNPSRRAAKDAKGAMPKKGIREPFAVKRERISVS